MDLPVILIVDDDPAQRALFSLMLRHLPCTVTAVGNAEDAQRLIRSHRDVLVILDVMMPWIDGISMLRAVRADPTLSSVKIILLSVMALQLDPHDTELADKVLAKPVVRTVLEREVRDLLKL